MTQPDQQARHFDDVLLMFFRRKEAPPAPTGISTKPLKMTTIPGAFYGGADPVIFANQPVQKTTESQLMPVIPDVTPPPSPPNPRPPMSRPATVAKTATAPAAIQMPVSQRSFFQNKIFVGGLAGLFLAGIGGITWYYLRPTPELPIETPIETPVVVVPTVPPIVPPPEEPIVVPPVETPTTTAPVATPPSGLQFPTILLSDQVDTDNDSLTDAEEEVFGTDSGIWDTDQDGYYDGQEVFNLYNPKGFAPVRLIDSGLIREYVHANFQYRVYYPVLWKADAVDVSGRQILFSAITGDYIEIQAVDREDGQTFEAWFATHAAHELYSDLKPFTNRFKESVFRRRDDLVAYIVQERLVFVIIYHPGVTDSIYYRHVMQMMLQSFRPEKTFVELPEQTVFPEELPAVDEAETTTPPPGL